MKKYVPNTARVLPVAMQFIIMSAMLLALILTHFSPAYAGDFAKAEFTPSSTPDLQLTINRSQVFSTREPLEEVVIGNPEVADIRLLSPQRVLIVGLKPGHTNLALRQKDGDVTAMDVIVSYDGNSIKQQIHAALSADNHIEVRESNDGIILTGQAATPAARDTALAIAHSFVPPDKVVNLMHLTSEQPVRIVRGMQITQQTISDASADNTAQPGTAPATAASVAATAQ